MKIENALSYLASSQPYCLSRPLFRRHSGTISNGKIKPLALFSFDPEIILEGKDPGEALGHHFCALPILRRRDEVLLDGGEPHFWRLHRVGGDKADLSANGHGFERFCGAD